MYINIQQFLNILQKSKQLVRQSDKINYLKYKFSNNEVDLFVLQNIVDKIWIYEKYKSIDFSGDSIEFCIDKQKLHEIITFVQLLSKQKEETLQIERSSNEIALSNNNGKFIIENIDISSNLFNIDTKETPSTSINIDQNICKIISTIAEKQNNLEEEINGVFIAKNGVIICTDLKSILIVKTGKRLKTNLFIPFQIIKLANNQNITIDLFKKYSTFTFKNLDRKIIIPSNGENNHQTISGEIFPIQEIKQIIKTLRSNIELSIDINSIEFINSIIEYLNINNVDINISKNVTLEIKDKFNVSLNIDDYTTKHNNGNITIDRTLKQFLEIVNLLEPKFPAKISSSLKNQLLVLECDTMGGEILLINSCIVSQ